MIKTTNMHIGIRTQSLYEVSIVSSRFYESYELYVLNFEANNDRN